MGVRNRDVSQDSILAFRYIGAGGVMLASYLADPMMPHRYALPNAGPRLDVTIPFIKDDHSNSRGLLDRPQVIKFTMRL